jgi:hypothetical protein
VLPPGNYGGIPTGPHSLDQLPLYSGLTPLRRHVSMSDVFHFYLPMNFSPIGARHSAPVGRSDVTVTDDAYGIPHIKGKTRAGMMFGAGWVMARDRGLLSAAIPPALPCPTSPASTPSPSSRAPPRLSPAGRSRHS